MQTSLVLARDLCRLFFGGAVARNETNESTTTSGREPRLNRYVRHRLRIKSRRLKGGKEKKKGQGGGRKKKFHLSNGVVGRQRQCPWVWGRTWRRAIRTRPEPEDRMRGTATAGVLLEVVVVCAAGYSYLKIQLPWRPEASPE